MAESRRPQLRDLTRHGDDGGIGLIVMRRREDMVWTVTLEHQPQPHVEEARERAQALLKEGAPLEPVPSGTHRRRPLHDLEGREPSKIFSMLFQPSRQNVAWLLNQLYLSLPRPDRNWAADCQTENFHTRLWEAQLLASFREQGVLVTRPVGSPISGASRYAEYSARSTTPFRIRFGSTPKLRR